MVIDLENKLILPDENPFLLKSNSKLCLNLTKFADSHLVHQIEDYILNIAVNGGIYYQKCSVARDGPLIESLEKN
jgi:hypothetical protein